MGEKRKQRFSDLPMVNGKSYMQRLSKSLLPHQFQYGSVNGKPYMLFSSTGRAEDLGSLGSRFKSDRRLRNQILDRCREDKDEHMKKFLLVLGGIFLLVIIYYNFTVRLKI